MKTDKVADDTALQYVRDVIESIQPGLNEDSEGIRASFARLVGKVVNRLDKAEKERAHWKCRAENAERDLRLLGNL